jgi:hypothetical protein
VETVAPESGSEKRKKKIFLERKGKKEKCSICDFSDEEKNKTKKNFFPFALFFGHKCVLLFLILYITTKAICYCTIN